MSGSDGFLVSSALAATWFSAGAGSLAAPVATSSAFAGTGEVLSGADGNWLRLDKYSIDVFATDHCFCRCEQVDITEREKPLDVKATAADT